MLPLIMSAGGFRLLVAALPLLILLILAGLIVLIAMLMPADRREFVLSLAPHVETAVAVIVGGPRTTSQPPELL